MLKLQTSCDNISKCLEQKTGGILYNLFSLKFELFARRSAIIWLANGSNGIDAKSQNWLGAKYQTDQVKNSKIFVTKRVDILFNLVPKSLSIKTLPK